MGTVRDEPGARVAAWKYGWWALVGAAFAFGLAGALTVGFLFVGAGLVLLLVGLFTPALRNSSALGAVGGLGVAPLYVAWLNKDGPGRTCRTADGVTTCIEQWNPWPWALVGLLLVVVCAVLVRRSRVARPPGAVSTGT
jgi:hypothetical protein